MTNINQIGRKTMGKRIFKYEGDTIIQNTYNDSISEFAKTLAQNDNNGKKLLIITGSGISNVPSMDELMAKLLDIVSEKIENKKISPQFIKLFNEYKSSLDASKSGDNSEHESSCDKVEMQGKFITYIQNAYLMKNDYVQEDDRDLLKEVWKDFIVYLIKGEEKKSDTDKYNGLMNASPTVTHEIIVELYDSFNTISITTNFDNLLEKAFKEKNNDKNFYPILDVEEFDRYICADESDDCGIEIQSRGDVFWIECTGNKKKICSQRKKRCLLPDEKISDDNSNEIKCPYCGSEANVYFAFPGTKEKDEEMTHVIDRIWKYFANSIGEIIIIGSSMDYDPVLVGFLREMITKRNMPILYISRLKDEYESKIDLMKERFFNEKEISKSMVTRLLFGEQQENNDIIWARSKDTSSILVDIYNAGKSYKNKKEVKRVADWENLNKTYADLIDGFYKKAEKRIPQLKESNAVFSLLNENKYFNRLKNFSQLGLKTYWKTKNENCEEHNRYNHSIGVMLIATRIYLELKKEKANQNELYFLMLAALLHDIGHLPFSHLFEDVFEELGWVPQGEKKSFNHEYYSGRIIDTISDGNFNDFLKSINYSREDIKRLINGEYGVGYLDAIINSPCDSDKIEYIHADTMRLNNAERNDVNNFINEFTQDLSTNSEEMLSIKGNSTVYFMRLIRMRSEMYDEIYYRKGLRFLEACCKMIIQTFIVYKVADIDELKNVREGFYDFSDMKIHIIIKYIEDLIEKQKGEDEGLSELFILKKMKSEIDGIKIVSDEIKNSVGKCYNWIITTKGEDKIKKLEENNIESYEIKKESLNRNRIKAILKDLYLRFPGVIMVDFIEKKPAFSYGKGGSEVRRADGTISRPENIIIKDINQSNSKNDFCCLGDAEKNINDRLNIVINGYIHIYRITDNRFLYMQAVDFIRHKLREEGIIIG